MRIQHRADVRRDHQAANRLDAGRDLGIEAQAAQVVFRGGGSRRGQQALGIGAGAIVERRSRSGDATGVIPHVDTGDHTVGPGPGSRGSLHGAGLDVAPPAQRLCKGYGTRRVVGLCKAHMFPFLRILQAKKYFSYG